MPDLKGSKTHDNLKEAFAGESQANRRYLYFAQKADVEGYPDVAALFRSVAEGETGPRVRSLRLPRRSGRPGDRRAVGCDLGQPAVAIAGETYEYTEMYPGFARTARDEDFEEIAEWLETLARAEKSHAGRFQPGSRIPERHRPDRRWGPAPAPSPIALEPCVSTSVRSSEPDAGRARPNVSYL